jgi:hypothetical protein
MCFFRLSYPHSHYEAPPHDIRNESKINSHFVAEAGVFQSVQRIGYGLDDRGIGVKFFIDMRAFSFLHSN